CQQARPDDPRCQDLQLPDPVSSTAYATCLEYNRLDVKACKDLRAAYEDELRAYLAARESVAPATLWSAGSQPPIGAPRIRELHRTAAELYRATSVDAQTFAAALVIPDVRRKIEAALRQSLPDDRLRAMAAQARAEALYWYAYMQGLERTTLAE